MIHLSSSSNLFVTEVIVIGTVVSFNGYLYLKESSSSLSSPLLLKEMSLINVMLS